MRALFCKIDFHSSICFCKPSPHQDTLGQLKLENVPHVLATTIVSGTHDISNVLHHVSGDGEIVREETAVDVNNRQGGGENCRKSSLKKPDTGGKESEKKRVQWMDFLGKKLVEITEFESSELEDANDEEHQSRGCICVIL